MKRSTLWLFCLVGLLICPSVQAQEVDGQGVLTQSVKDAVKRAMIEGHIPSLTIALVRGDKIIWSDGFGYSNLWARTPAVPETVYLIGSTFKTMSTYALLQQMEQGKFELDDPVSPYLKGIRIKDENPEQPVTFRHLLTHTSGLPGDFGPHPVWGDTAPSPLEAYLEKSLRVTHPPLNKLVYSNMAYTLIGFLVQQFSGISYKEYMRKNILTPVDMKDTDFFPRQDMEERLSVPYIYSPKEERQTPADRLKADVWPAGIVYGTVLDQAKWLITNLNSGIFNGHRLIESASFDQMMSVQYVRFNGPIGGDWLNENTGYGLTWWITPLKGETLFAHSGSVPGYTAFLAGNVDQKIGVAILTNGNRAHPHLYRLAKETLDLLMLNVH